MQTVVIYLSQFRVILETKTFDTSAAAAVDAVRSVRHGRLADGMVIGSARIVHLATNRVVEVS